MITAADPSALRYHSHRVQLPKSRPVDGRKTIAITTLPSATKRSHELSLALTVPDFSHQTSKPEENYHLFPKSLLKDRSSLVATRLSLKRQRATLKGPSRHFGPVHLNVLQMELGNPEEFLVPWNSDDDYDDHDDQNEKIRTNSPRTVLSQEQSHMQFLSPNTSALQVTSPHALPTDISMLYKEKPVYSHPITGQILNQYTEENGSPSPCSYVLPRKSCREKNAPAFTFGSRCLVEKKGGSRTAWNKQWFAHSNPFTTKVDFNREPAWPTPVDYGAPSTHGIQTTKVSFPAWTIATRLQTNPMLTHDASPSPNTYETMAAFQKLTAKTSHITLKSRPGGTQLSTKSSAGIAPGPGTHDQTKFFSNKYSAPKYSFGKRLPISFGQDPYVNTSPPIET